ncbi:DivIVA domain-containing protein [Micromonospora narathiwatensis]|uniref:DivIVA domain-containing protein n=1 Tax=Micromonospora narathiwatensis TaxID=299146 RepID=A0A1A9AEH8_9ACTN|nr:DivIVA domain-containing protein [Micromonospora narathiwatensis]SBT54923.1 DivIVA domain-containing protein [Micromonospora narathiwatensis]
MTVYRSRNALRGPFTPDRIAALSLPVTRRGYRIDEVDALLHRLAFELGERTRQLTEVCAENRQIKDALRSWQSAEAARRLGE